MLGSEVNEEQFMLTCWGWQACQNVLAVGHFFPVRREMESKTLISQEWQNTGQSCSSFLLQLCELLYDWEDVV